MIYKKFEGETLAEAIAQAKLAYGSNIQLIDQQKKIQKKGLFGIFGRREYIEITVNIQNSNPSNIKKKLSQNVNDDSSIAIAQIKKLIEARKSIQTKTPVLNNVGSADIKGLPSQGKDVYSEIMELKGTLENLVNASSVNNGRTKNNDKKEFDYIRNFFEKNDFEKYFINQLIDHLSSSLTVKELDDKNKVREVIELYLKDQINTSVPKLKTEGPRMIALVGPTGVGKTTTIAKIGAGLNYEDKKDIAFLTIDNYRIGAKEQIAKYAEIMELPLHTITEKEHFERVLEDNNHDYYLLDTAGRNQKKELEINEIKSYLRMVNIPIDIYLVISATTKYSDLLEIMEKFEIMNYDKVIISKVDETNTYGSVISAISEKKKKISYICSGQKVPDDIKIAEKQDLVTRVMMKFALADE